MSNLRDVADKNLEMYVPWNQIRGIISRQDMGDFLRTKLEEVKITPKMLFILVAVGLFVWNLKRRAVCDVMASFLVLFFFFFPFEVWFIDFGVASCFFFSWSLRSASGLDLSHV